MTSTNTTSFPVRLLLIAVGALLLSFGHALGATDLSGTWVLDLRASSSPDQMLKRLGASWVERQFGGSLQLKATYIQTPDSLTAHLRGVGFQSTYVVRTDNKPQMQQDPLLGRYTIRTFWSGNGTQLISAVSLRTKDSRDAQVTIVRELADGGKTLNIAGTLKITGESGTWTLRRIWRKRTS